ncbi:hypothetical protein RCXUPER_158 [Rhodobacter phage RcXuper]|nr:hypothetical protein RCXUPER_158 [Rhodobacter phage RcXuper]
MTPKIVDVDDALFAAAALMEVAERMEARGRTDLAARARKVAEGLQEGGVITVKGSA